MLGISLDLFGGLSCPQLFPEAPVQAQISPITASVGRASAWGEDDERIDAALAEIEGGDGCEPQGVEGQVYAEDVLQVVEAVSVAGISLEFFV